MSSFHQKISTNILLLFILISISCKITIATDQNIARKTEEISTTTIPDPSIKCDTCPCDTCEPILPPPPPPPAPLPCPPPPPPPCPPPPSPPPPPKQPPCYPCMEEHSPPPPRFSYTPGNDLYVTEYNYSAATQANNIVMALFVFVGVAFLQLTLIL